MESLMRWYDNKKQAGLDLAIWVRLALSSWSSCLRLPGTGITGMCHHALVEFLNVLLGK